ncbi:hypothetical protein [Sandarakinorhabdus sp.]|uniref:hypothetical protein n=1 Tax=Sandarakinorhabdus sp. TaxID=1916663 RepID=UPI00286E90AC|nr:hypothetical protein [Sandarakinorhabdus sp.]
MMRIWIAAALLASPLAAAPAPHSLALAAGYKAAFVCSGRWNAGQDMAAITADDLTGIYGDYQALVADLPVAVDDAARTVSVAFDAKLPPRIAVWRPLLGCAQLPVGAGPDVAALVPRLTPDLKQPDLARLDAAPWPLGDAQASARMLRRLRARLDALVAAGFAGD